MDVLNEEPSLKLRDIEKIKGFDIADQDSCKKMVGWGIKEKKLLFAFVQRGRKEHPLPITLAGVVVEGSYASLLGAIYLLLLKPTHSLSFTTACD